MIADFLCKTKTSKCTPVKNPCKICLGHVSHKNGLQCQGACKKWAHYKCLRYTPGKIADIKAGRIKVLCPCPDCETTKAKEYLTNPPYTCSNQDCPGNDRGPVRCTSEKCPHNAVKQTTKKWCSPKVCADNARQDGTQTKDYSSRRPYLARPIIDDAPEKHSPYQNPGRLVEDELADPTQTKQLPSRNPYADHPSEHASGGSTLSKYPRYPKKTEKAGPTSENNSCDDLVCDKDNITEGEDVEQMKNALHEMCGTVTQLSKQIKELMCKIKMKEENQEL